MEQFIGLSLLRYFRSRNLRGHLYYWRDLNGPEVDFVVEKNNLWLPIEVKFSENPQAKHIQHLKTFLAEYPDKCDQGYLVYPGSIQLQLDANIKAIPWFKLPEIFSE